MAGQDEATWGAVDVVVVGCGIAGLAAAVTAAEGGQKVQVLERATFTERGGNTRYTEAFLRMRDEATVSDDFEADFAANAGYHLDPALVAGAAGDYANWPSLLRSLSFADPELVATFASGIPEAVAWLKGHGVRFGDTPFFGLTESIQRIAVQGGGLALIEALTPIAERLGVAFAYQTTAHDLVIDGTGRVAGVRAMNADGGRGVYRAAKGVVLASGGFQGNAEMMARYIGPHGRYARPVSRGGYYNKGEGIRMALAIGAAPAGDYSDFHAEPIDPRSGKTEAVVMIFPLGILVNREGQRFFDEAQGTVDRTYEAASRAANRQSGGLAFCVLDGKLDQVQGWQRTIRTEVPPIAAATLDELAAAAGIAREPFRATIAAFNAACPPGEGFDARRLDGLATRGLFPPKSNWARPIDRAPFRCYPVIAANTFTFGGLKVDPDARVLSTDGVAIPGLYAAGETVGIYYGRYTGSTSVLRGAHFGRRAGRHAARR
ncbi:MAG: FAD-dependent oxidoreductase [Alphaproteobacteria bacterium]|nr:FAD-dependent oxidoreductase [Alphaproteobacteria bacterium]